jgi:DNA recombination protein RmuC
MFIPNESSYLLAMENAPSLAMEAFKRHVIIVNPTTLLLCLQIVALLRSREAQNENAEKISKSAAKMYEKFVNFARSFIDIGKNIDTLKGTYTTAYGRLCEGNANVIKQLESLKDMGIVTAHQIPQKILEAAQVTNDDEQISS